MRDCLNMHYSAAGLTKRKGATKLCDISCEDELYNIQGIFLFTYKITYIVIASDGKLYSGYYTPHSTITLTRLHINVESPNISLESDPVNLIGNLEIYYSEKTNEHHDGFIHRYLKDLSTQQLFNDAEIIDYVTQIQENDSIPSNTITKYKNNYYRIKQSVPKRLNTPDTTNSLWTTVKIYGTTPISYTIENFFNKTPISESDIASLQTTKNYKSNNGSKWKIEYNNETGEFLLIDRPSNWSEKNSFYHEGDLVFYKDILYRCLKDHSVYALEPNENDSIKFTKLEIINDLIFQNKYPIEGATLNNSLYLTTGTRYVKVSYKENTLVATSVIPYIPNIAEYINIGPNYISKYPNQCIQTSYNEVTTALRNLLVIKDTYGSYTLKPIFSFSQNENEDSYYYKWEKEINNEWVVLHSFKDNIKILDSIELNNKYTYTGDEWSANRIYNINDVIKINSVFYKCVLQHKPSTLELTCFCTEYKDKENVTQPLWQELYTKYNFVGNFWNANVLYNVNDVIQIDSLYYKCITPHTPKDLNITKFSLTYVSKADEEPITLWQRVYEPSELSEDIIKRKYSVPFKTINVTDADKFRYRVTVAKVFSQNLDIEKYERWNPILDYKEGDKVIVDTRIFKCIHDQPANLMKEFKISHTITKTESIRILDSSGEIQTQERDYNETTYYWTQDGEDEIAITMYNDTTKGITYTTDYSPNKATGDYFGQATSILYTNDNDTTYFDRIHSCKKITKDGNKLLLYDDYYNSGEFYKTVIDNPEYITVNKYSQLNFKTTKNESVLKIIPFSGSLVVFTLSNDLGGSIHLVTGNGDDFQAQDDNYYSPYKRQIINVNISCDNINTIQVAGNYLFFKYFTTIYYIIASDLSNEVITLYSANDRIKQSSKYVSIPWDDNSCISEVTDTYYALIWKEKYIIEDDRLILERPGMRIKLYYTTYHQINNKVFFPWLRDESKYFNIDYIIYLNAQPIYLYNNILMTFNEEVYTDFGEIYPVSINFKGYSSEYEGMVNFLSNLTINYYNDQGREIDFKVVCTNEAGHVLLDSSNPRKTLQDLRIMRTGQKLTEAIRLDTASVISKVFNTQYKFPYLYAEVKLTAETENLFTISNIIFNYTTGESPDKTPFDTYSNIIRKTEVK